MDPNHTGFCKFVVEHIPIQYLDITIWYHLCITAIRFYHSILYHCDNVVLPLEHIDTDINQQRLDRLLHLGEELGSIFS